MCYVFGSYLFPETQVRVGEMVQWLMVDSSLPKNLDDGSLLLHVVLLGGYENLKKWNIVKRSFEFCKHAFGGVWSTTSLFSFVPQPENKWFLLCYHYVCCPATDPEQQGQPCMLCILHKQNVLFITF